MRGEIQSVRFTVCLHEDLNEQLEQMARTRRMPKGHIVRQAIMAWGRMEVENQPTCANGTSCLCPARWGHTQRPTAEGNGK
jgi:hypothetical protein